MTAKRKFRTYPIAFFHIDIAEMRTEEGKLHLFVGIDRTSKFTFVGLNERRPLALRRRLPAPPHRGRALSRAHRPDRQWHPLHRS